MLEIRRTKDVLYGSGSELSCGGMGLRCGDWFFPNKEEMLICDPHLFPIKNYLLYGTNPVGISARKCSN